MQPYRNKGSACCIAVGCCMRSNTNLLSKIRMYSFPADPTRRKLWEIAVRRENWTPKCSSRICSLHFITGKPSKDPKHPDYVPSIFSYNKRPVSLKEFEIYKRQRDAMDTGIKEMGNSNQNDFVPIVFCWSNIPRVKNKDSETKQEKCVVTSHNNVMTEEETEDEDIETLYLEYKALEKEKQELEKRLKMISETSFT